ncbi:MAG: exodeoxyribonuclease VII small subunit [bacterium]|nr:exodeoxyribonuclease VII small subunit [bacterium]
MSNKINQKMAEIDKILVEIENGEVPLEEVSAKYKSAVKLVNEIEEALENISNEIEIISEDFSK